MTKAQIRDNVSGLIISVILFFGIYFFDTEADALFAAIATAFFMGVGQIIWMIGSLVWWMFTRKVKV